MTNEKKPANTHDGHRKRMRARLKNDLDMVSYAEHEMLEQLLFYGIPRKNTNELAHLLINTFGSYGNVFGASLAALEKVKGMTENAAMLIKIIGPISRAVGVSRTKGKKFLYTSDDALMHFESHFINEPREVAFAACLDIGNRIINVTNIGKGSGAETSIDMQKLIEAVSSSHADKVVLMHNHPSGNLSPSDEDIFATNLALVSLVSVNAKLIDHIIFTPNGQYFSFYQNRIIDALVENANRFLAASNISDMLNYDNKINYYDKGVRLNDDDRDAFLQRIGDLFKLDK